MDLSVPSRFFATSGKAVSKISDLNAFDRALWNAGMAEYNLVRVSSILPANLRKIQKLDLPRGTILHCVLAQMNGNEGESISAGIAYGFREDGKGGYMVEGNGHLGKVAMRKKLASKIHEMASVRKVEMGPITYLIEDTLVPMGHYGACVAALALI